MISNPPVYKYNATLFQTDAVKNCMSLVTERAIQKQFLYFVTWVEEVGGLIRISVILNFI